MVGVAQAAFATQTAEVHWTALPTLTLSLATQEPEKGYGSLGTRPRVR